MNNNKCAQTRPGKVWLVGAGAGAEDLLTLKALNTLKQADVVIYDALINRRILRHCSPGAEQLFVGKRAGAACLTQSEINELVIQEALAGKRVVRLKGGDPFIFGRGGEEALALKAHDLEFEVIPGVTAALAAAAYAGIPLTMRGMASSVTLVTGHEAGTDTPGETEVVDNQVSKLDWVSLAKGSDTLVIYMGLKNLAAIVARLKSAGRAGTTPAAVILWGTLNNQQTVKGSLDNIYERVQNDKHLQHPESFPKLAPAALLIIGNVVGYSAQLAWFDKKPLKGLRILLTRNHDQRTALYERLYAAGAEVIEFPTLDIKPITENKLLDNALLHLSSYDWLIFTSVNTVQFVLQRLWDTGADLRRLAHIKIAAVGRQTEQALHEHHLKADLVPADYSAVSLLEAFKRFFKEQPHTFKELSFLFPGSSLVSDLLPVELMALGAHVTTIPVYENNLPVYTADEFNHCWNPLPDLAVFTSSSTVIHLAQLLTRFHRLDLLQGLKAAVIGPVTARTARSYGLAVEVEAPVHTSDDLVDAIYAYYQKRLLTNIFC
jgi:uroporphyrinogen III methyltransferase/synthase